MKQILTAKVKLQTTPEQLRALRQTQLAYRDALNYVSRYAFEHGKMSSGRALQRDCYDEIRRQYHLPAQLACNVARQVGATYKGLWTKVKHNAALRKAGQTKKRYKGLDQPPKYVSPTLTYNFHRDYSLKQDTQVSILTLQGRVILPDTGNSSHVAWLQQDGHIGAAQLWYDKPRKQFYLLVTLEIEVTDPTAETHKGIVGVDVGQRYLAVSTDTTNHTTFSSGKAVRAKADHYARLTKRLQKKGTAPLNASMAIKVDAYHTSQACPTCGYVSPGNRPNKGLVFVCQTCHFSLHADLIGARNITLRTVLTRQDWMSTGILSICPDVSCDEAKAANRQRYAELRWSTDTSPPRKLGGH